MLRKKAGSSVPGARPRDISKPGWRAAAKRTFSGLTEHNVPLISAGVAFYGMLAIFPALTALISVYGLIADPADVQQLLNAGVLPPGVANLLQGHARSLAGPGNGALSISVIIGFLLTLWSARQGANAIIKALNVVYGESETRGLLHRIGLSLVFTLASIVFAVLALIAVILIPSMLGQLNLGPMWQLGISAIRWPILAVLVGGGVAALYRYAPDRHRPAWRWVVLGAAVATVLWLIGSGLFSLYVSHFANYNKSYGSLGTIVVLLLWLFISSLIVLIGAELNSAVEQQVAIEADIADDRRSEDRRPRR
ncbi:MAG TPA: YihY/virulence factor BrkB family protein [Gammaproteobacteria bacterium]|nr:YihY/virulence factor BrkB family protein [Gammaproteobacteria bacterium]